MKYWKVSFHDRLCRDHIRDIFIETSRTNLRPRYLRHLETRMKATGTVSPTRLVKQPKLNCTTLLE